MKVTTVACVQGAWLPEVKAKRILDIGAGSGILSLMAAQQFDAASIDAVEIDRLAYEQLEENIAQNPWSDRIVAIYGDILAYAKTCRASYDLIVCNPPFFRNHLRSVDVRKRKARHDTTLSLSDLIKCINKLLSPTGKVSILLPYFEAGTLATLGGSNGLHIEAKLLICDRLEKAPKSMVTILGRIDNRKPTEKLVIKEASGKYTSAFSTLLKDYYLYL